MYRVIGPPDPAWHTRASPFSDLVFRGGPFLVWPTWENDVDSARVQFPEVSTDRLQDVVFQDRVLAIRDPTDILLIKGFNDVSGLELNWGRTEVALDRMGIPYTVVNIDDVSRNPNLLFGHNLIVADCPAWDGRGIPGTVSPLLRNIVHDGGTLVFTDRALRDLPAMFPGSVDVTLNEEWPAKRLVPA